MSRYVSKKDGGKQTVLHRVIAEEVLGKRLPVKAVVHHVDGNGRNNAKNNLVICPSQAYHKFIHYREDALNECGDPDWLRCIFCRKFGDSKLMMVWKLKGRKSFIPRAAHYACSRIDLLKRRQSGYIFRKKN